MGRNGTLRYVSCSQVSLWVMMFNASHYPTEDKEQCKVLSEKMYLDYT